jgi:hypothetical protein
LDDVVVVSDEFVLVRGCPFEIAGGGSSPSGVGICDGFELVIASGEAVNSAWVDCRRGVGSDDFLTGPRWPKAWRWVFGERSDGVVVPDVEADMEMLFWIEATGELAVLLDEIDVEDDEGCSVVRGCVRRLGRDGLCPGLRGLTVVS